MKKSMKIGALTMLAAMTMLMVIPLASAPPPGGVLYTLVDIEQISVYYRNGWTGRYIGADVEFRSYSRNYDLAFPDKTDIVTVYLTGTTNGGSSTWITISSDDYPWGVLETWSTNAYVKTSPDYITIQPRSNGAFSAYIKFNVHYWYAPSPDVEDREYIWGVSAVVIVLWWTEGHTYLVPLYCR